MKTSFNKLILNVLIGFTCQIISLSGAQAAIIICEHQETACNEQGDQYLCRGYGWIYIEDFCSETDLTKKRPFPTAPFINSESQDSTCVEECKKLPNPKAVLCEIYRCGNW